MGWDEALHMSLFNANEADNLEDIEKQFAVKAVQQLTAYWGLISRVRASTLRLTKRDDEIYEALIAAFPEFQNKEHAAKVLEADMKSPAGKAAWRDFCEKFKDIEDYNFGTLLRTNAAEKYEEHNTIFVVRIQFYAVEIARNRHGLNDWASESS